MTTACTVRARIAELERRFTCCPSAYLTESDVQAYLFSLLLQDFGEPESVHNIFPPETLGQCPTLRFMTRRLHSELELPEGRIDLAVLDLSRVVVGITPSTGRFRLLRPQRGDHFFIEIKVSRTHRSEKCKAVWVQSIRSDIQKLQLNRLANHSALICCDFGGLLNEAQVRSLDDLLQNNVELYYFRSAICDRYLDSSQTPM